MGRGREIQLVGAYSFSDARFCAPQTLTEDNLVLVLALPVNQSMVVLGIFFFFVSLALKWE